MWRYGIAALALVLAGAVTLVLRASPSHPGAEHIRSLVDWSGCAGVRISDTPPSTRAWSRARERSAVSCEHAGPLIVYARFDDVRDLRRDLLSSPPPAGVCVAGNEVLVDHFLGGDFPALCRRLRGTVVDAVSALPPAQFEDRRQASAAEGRALRRHWDG